jgi:invasion protein IalB
MKYRVARARPAGRALTTALTVLIVAAVNAQTPPKAPAAAPATKPPAAAPAPQQAAAPAQDQQLKLVYSPWTKICPKVKEANAKEVCLTGREGRLETGQPVISAWLIQPQGLPNALRVTLPLAVQLQRGTRVMVDQVRLANMTSDTEGRPYTLCFANGCEADFEATPDVINQLKNGKSLWVQGISVTGELINLPLPLEEFGKTLDGPPTDPKVIEAQQKKMQDELQKRAEAVKKQLESQQGAAAQPGK